MLNGEGVTFTFGGHTTHWDRIEVESRVLMHPDDLKDCPPVFGEMLQRHGIALEGFIYVERHKMYLFGPIAAIMANLQFHEDVQAAMKENEQFLKLMRNSGLA